MTETNENKKLDWTKLFIGFSLLLCAFSLVFIAVTLQPVAHWASNQNICVQEEQAKSGAPISWGVRKCNGRSKVYQVK